MRDLSIMIKPVSGRCQLRCGYCFYRDAAERRAVPCPGPMSLETAERLLRQVFRDAAPGDRVSFCFQGGEPTLIGAAFLRSFVDRAEVLSRGAELSWSIQTHGLLLGDELLSLFRERSFLVGLSFDLLPEVHDAARVDPRGTPTASRVLRAAERLAREGIDFNILATLTRPLAQRPREAWDVIRQHGFRFVQITPCAAPLGPVDGDPWSLTPRLFASFTSQLFDLWHEAFLSGDYISVKLFDDLVHRLAFGSVTACGLDGRCRPQLVVEADGSVYPCDFYCLDDLRLGDLRTDPPEVLLDRAAALPFMRGALPVHCVSCPHAALCGGGCRRMRGCVFPSPRGGDCGMRLFLDRSIDRLQALAIRQRQLRREQNGV